MVKELGVVEKISFIKNIKPEMDLCTVRIGFDELYIYYDINDLSMFLNQNVEYSWRDDMIDGLPKRVITDIAVFKTVQVVESVENIKLIPEGTKRTVCNFAIKDVKFGDYKPRCISYLCGCTRGSSPYTKWVDMNMIDIDSREFRVRIFTKDPNGTEKLDETLDTFVGHYVMYDIQSTQYGFQTKEVEVLTNAVEISPEVKIAQEVIKNEISKDPALMELETAFNLTTVLLWIIDGEPGYQLVRMASEIYIINALSNISTNLDIQTMKQAVICSRLYCLPSNIPRSRPVLNINRTSKVKGLRENIELMSILDPMNPGEVSDTKRMYIKVRGMVNDIIDIRRGINNEKDSDALNAYMSMLNGLL